MKLLQATNDQIVSLYNEYFIKHTGGINHYLERRILSSTSYIIKNPDIVGICSIDEEKWLTGFYITDQSKYSEILSYLIEKNYIKNIYFTDMDKRLLQEIRDRGFHTEVHSYNFGYTEDCITDFEMELVQKEEVLLVKEAFRDFLEYNNVDVYNTDLYVHKQNNEYVSLGFYEKYKLINRASTAMIVNPKFRKQGYGTKTLMFLAALLKSKNIPINSRCWVQNEASKKTLQKAGFQITSHTVKAYKKE